MFFSRVFFFSIRHRFQADCCAVKRANHQKCVGFPVATFSHIARLTTSRSDLPLKLEKTVPFD